MSEIHKADIHKTIEAVWKIESTRLIAGIARVTRDIGIAEELAQDALVAALERWPEEGIPEKPAAWLMTAAKRRAIDSLRRGRMLEQKHGEIARELEFQQQRLSAKHWTNPWTRSLTMMSSASSLPPAILCSRLKGASLLRCV